MNGRKATIRVEGSFRDPSGHVFTHDGGVYRAIDNDYFEIYQTFCDEGILPKLIERNLVVETSLVTSADLLKLFRDEHPGFEHFLHHEKIPFISFPYEWSFSMLADAAVHTLKLQRALLKKGYTLKDATPYNIQFVSGKPTFIDLTSIERPDRLDMWFALGQFQRLFYFPLLLCYKSGWDLRSYYLGSINGQALEQVSASLGRMRKYSPGNLLDVGLPLLLERRDNNKAAKAGKSAKAPEGKPVDMSKSGGSAQTQLFNLGRLEKKINKLRKAHGKRHKSVWADYTSTCTYDSQSTDRKSRLIGEFLEDRKPATVLDLGCNTGNYSLLAAGAGSRVISADFDMLAIDTLYKRVSENANGEDSEISPLVLDLANPSPAIGYMNVERESFLERGRSECVFGLALMHHLLVSQNMDLEAISRLFAALSEKYLVLEFVPKDDPMFARLLRFRRSYFEKLDLPQCIKAFEPRFSLLKEAAIEGTMRTLLFFEKK